MDTSRTLVESIKMIEVLKGRENKQRAIFEFAQKIQFAINDQCWREQSSYIRGSTMINIVTSLSKKAMED